MCGVRVAGCTWKGELSPLSPARSAVYPVSDALSCREAVPAPGSSAPLEAFSLSPRPLFLLWFVSFILCVSLRLISVGDIEQREFIHLQLWKILPNCFTKNTELIYPPTNLSYSQLFPFFFFARGTVKKWYFILVLILYITHHWVKLNIFSYVFVSYVLLHLWFVFLYFAFCNWTVFFLICRNSLLIWDSTILPVMYVANILWSHKQNGSMMTPGILLLLLAQAENLCPSLSGSDCDSTQVCFGLRAPLPPMHTSKSWVFPVCKASSAYTIKRQHPEWTEENTGCVYLILLCTWKISQ